MTHYTLHGTFASSSSLVRIYGFAFQAEKEYEKLLIIKEFNKKGFLYGKVEVRPVIEITRKVTWP